MNRDTRRTLLAMSRWPIGFTARGAGGTVIRESGHASPDVVAEFFGELWILLLLILLIVGIAAGQPWIVALAVISGLVGVVSRLWSRLSLEDFDYTRKVSQDHMFPGDEFELTITVENRKPLPVPWVRIREEVPVELEILNARTARGDRSDTVSLRSTLSLAWYERVRRRYRVRANRRGYLHIGPTMVQSGDLFGLFRAARTVTLRDAVVVYPNIVPLPDLDLPSARPVGEARSPVRIFEDLNRPSGLRDYRSGDSMRRIDWKATARLREPHVRTYDHSVEHYMVMLVDVLTAELSWEGYSRRLLERVVCAAASVASRGTELGYRVGMISNGIPLGETGRMIIPPGADPRQLAAILEALAMVRPLAIGRLDSVMASAPRAIPFGATVVAISAVMPERVLHAVDNLVARGHPAVAMYVGDSAPPAVGGRFEVRDTGALFDTGDTGAEERSAE